MSLTIEFDAPEAKYVPGKAVTGKVTLINNTPIEATNLKMTMFVVYGLNVSEARRKELRNYYIEVGNKYRTEHPTETKRYIIDEKIIQLGREDKRKTKVYPIGSHIFNFSFSPLSTNCSFSWDNSKDYNCYIVEAQLGIKSTKDCLTVKKSFNVLPRYPLEENKTAMGWQTKTGSKFAGLSLKKQMIKVTVPNGVGINESVPIHISIINESNNSAVIIRSKLIQKNRTPTGGFTIYGDGKESTISENLQETHGNQVLHLLSLEECDPSFDSPHMSLSYYIQVEVETSPSAKVKMDFPVIVGFWNGNPKRPELKNYLESINEKLTIPVPPAVPAPRLSKHVSPALPPRTSSVSTSSPASPPKKPTQTKPVPTPSPEKEILKIELNAQDDSYLPGQKVSGTVLLENSVPITATCLKMFMFAVFKVTGSTEAKSRKIGEATVQLMNTKEEKNNSNPVGSSKFGFHFPELPLNITPSLKKPDACLNYHVRADLSTTARIITKLKYFKVKPCPLEYNESAQSWQTKIDSKFTGLSSKEILMNVTVPTGVAFDESILIHMFMKNQSDESLAIVRSRLLKRVHEKLEYFPKESKTEEIKGTFIQEIAENSSDQTIFISLKIDEKDPSVNSPYFSCSYYLQVEMETSDSTLLKVQFPVIVGPWRDGKPIRPELKGYLELNRTRQPTLVSSILPSSLLGEHVGGSIAPPSYDEAILAAPQIYPSPPQKF